MNSRPLLDYLSDAHPSEPVGPEMESQPGIDVLVARLKNLEARLKAPNLTTRAEPDITLAAQIEAILKRQSVLEPEPQPARHSEREPVAEQTRPVSRPVSRMAVEPPPIVDTAGDDKDAIQSDFRKFAEAVYMMGQAAKRFVDMPETISAPQPVRDVRPQPAANAEISALTAVLHEAISAFRSVADDLAVSAGEIRNFATREPSRERAITPPRRASLEEDDIHELRDNVAELQDRLDALLHSRRRVRY